MAETEDDDAVRREKDMAALRTALDNLYGKGPEADEKHDDPVVFLRQLSRRVRTWLQHLTDEDVETYERLADQHQTAVRSWRRVRKLTAWMGATILATLAFGEQALSFLKTLRDLLR